MPGAAREIGVAALGGLAIAGAAKARGTETHGRWPWTAAIAAPPTTVAAFASRDRFAPGAETTVLASLPLLLWHQTEEWVMPAGFLPWFNRSVWQSEDDEFPVTPGMAFRINVIAGWGGSVLAAATVNSIPGVACALLASHAANGALHMGRAIEERTYNPGLASALIMGPLGVIGAAKLISDSGQRRRGALAGVLAGLLASAALPLSLRRRVQRAQKRPSHV